MTRPAFRSVHETEIRFGCQAGGLAADGCTWSVVYAPDGGVEEIRQTGREHFTSAGHEALERAYQLAEEAARSLLRSGSSLVADSEHEFGFATLAVLSRFESRELIMEEVGTFHGFAGDRSGEKIDTVLTSSGWRIREAWLVTLNDDGRYPSDDFPVMAVVEFRAESAS